MRIIWCCILFFTISMNSLAQDAKGLQDSVYYYFYSSPSKTQYFVDQVLPMYEQEENWEQYLFCFYILAESYYHQGDYTKSTQYLNETFEKGQSIDLPEMNFVYSYAWNLKGLLANLEGNYYRAAIAYKKALDIDNKRSGVPNDAKAIKYQNLASAYDEFGDYITNKLYYLWLHLIYKA